MNDRFEISERLNPESDFAKQHSDLFVYFDKELRAFNVALEQQLKMALAFFGGGLFVLFLIGQMLDGYSPIFRNAVLFYIAAIIAFYAYRKWRILEKKKSLARELAFRLHERGITMSVEGLMRGF